MRLLDRKRGPLAGAMPVALALTLLVSFAAMRDPRSDSFAAGTPTSAGHLHGYHEYPELVAPSIADAEWASDLEPRTEPGGSSFTHGGDGSSRSTGGSIELLRIGELAFEPTLDFTDDRTLLYQGMSANQPTPLSSEPVLHRTRDGGRSWEEVTPAGPQHENTADPYLYVDPATSRAFTAHYQIPTCATIAWTDDGGDSWDQSVGGCGLLDHQTVFAGPPVVSPTLGYPNVVYYCAIIGFGPFSQGTGCQKSLDGGRSFLDTGGLPFHTDPGRGSDPLFDVPGYCTGAVGHGVVDKRGVVYLPAGQCGQPWVAISDDEGATWRHVQVATNGMAQADEGIAATDCHADSGVDEVDEPVGTVGCSGERTWIGHEVRVAVDEDRNVYATWVAADHAVYLAVMRADEESFGSPIRVSPPNVVDASLPAIAVGDPGGVAVAYIGSENAPPPRHCGETHWTSCRIRGGSLEEYHRDATWNGYITVTRQALQSGPLFITAAANPADDPFERGFCGQVRCGRLGDFFDVTIGPDGRAWAAFADACLPEREGNPCGGALYAAAEGVVAHMLGGPKLA